MHMSQIFHQFIKIAIFVSLLLTFNQLAVAGSSSLYDVDVLVVDEEADTRWRVFKEGLDEVFVRISGDSIVMDKLKRPPASRFIKQYSYDPVDKPVINEDGKVLNHRLKIQYNGSAMEQYLRDNGYPVWGQHRTDVVIWLAIRDGKNEYVLKESDQSLLKTSADEALQRRGISDRWPRYDSKDRKILKVADIRGGFEAPVTTASKRYSNGPALTGSLIWNGRKWQSSWSLLMSSGNKHWSIENADYNQLINKAIDQAADAMGIVYAVHGSTQSQQLATLQLEVQAINSIKKYRKLESYLRDLSVVAMARPLKVDAENVTFEVKLRSNEQDFLSQVKNDAKLIEIVPIIDESVVTPIEKVPANIESKALVSSKNDASKVVINAIKNSPETVASQQLTPLLDETKLQTPVYYYKLNN